MTIHPMSRIKPLILFILLLIGFCDLSAQDKEKFSVTDFHADPFDLSAASEYEKLDGNGDRYAIIKITSTNPNTSITSTLVI